MRVLVIGGTQFIGRHIVSSLLADGDDGDLVPPGRAPTRNCSPGLSTAWGTGTSNCRALASGTWDATIDTSAYVPRQVRTLAEVLGGRGGRYVQISSVSAYADPQGPGLTEHAPLAVLDDPTTEVVNGHTYGGLKALCEQEALQSFGLTGADVSIVRPTYVAGPYDYTGRFTWWVERVARGGRVLAPGPGRTRSRSSTPGTWRTSSPCWRTAGRRGPSTPSARGRRSRWRTSSPRRWTPWGRPGLSSFGSTRKLSPTPA